MPRRNEAPKMDTEATPPPIPEAAKKRKASTKKLEGKRTSSHGKELPEGVTRLVPFEDLNEVSSPGMAPGSRRKKQAIVDKTADMTEHAVEEPEGEVIEMEAEPASAEEREEMEWQEKLEEAKKRDFLAGAAAFAKEQAEKPADADLSAAYDAAMEQSEEDRALAAYKEAHPTLSDNEGYRRLGMKQQAEEALSKGYEARKKREAKEAAAKEKVGASGFTEKEEAWFKAGEDEEARQMAEARATIERGGKGELMVENPDDVEANVKAAADLMKKGDLSPRDFSVEDYAYLLKERVRIDKELESAGWWKARGLRKELAQVLKGGYNGAPNGLEGYEKQVMDAKLGSGAMKRAEAEKAAPAKKPSFWERLRMSKGR